MLRRGDCVLREGEEALADDSPERHDLSPFLANLCFCNTLPDSLLSPLPYCRYNVGTGCGSSAWQIGSQSLKNGGLLRTTATGMPRSMLDASKARVPRKNVVSHGAEVEEAKRLRNRVAELETKV